MVVDRDGEIDEDIDTRDETLARPEADSDGDRDSDNEALCDADIVTETIPDALRLGFEADTEELAPDVRDSENWAELDFVKRAEKDGEENALNDFVTFVETDAVSEPPIDADTELDGEAVAGADGDGEGE
jgi:hypothetical protein